MMWNDERRLCGCRRVNEIGRPVVASVVSPVTGEVVCSVCKSADAATLVGGECGGFPAGPVSRRYVFRPGRR